MDRNNSYGKSWADQWDSNPDNQYVGSVTNSNKKPNGGGPGYGKKVGEGLGKTKAVASVGLKKVKEGTSLSLGWIKQKYNHSKTSSTTQEP